MSKNESIQYEVSEIGNTLRPIHYSMEGSNPGMHRMKVMTIFMK